MSENLAELETEAIEIILMLDTLRDGSGPKAFGLYQQAAGSWLRPLLLKQRAPLATYVAKLDAQIAAGATIGEAAESLREGCCAADATVLELERHLAAVWQKLIADLSALGRERLAQNEGPT